MQAVTNFPHAISDQPDVGIVMSDGCRLSARIWMPVDAAQNPLPAVLEYIPYRKRDGTAARDEMLHPYMAGHGYACVRVDLRGSGDSGGILTDEYTLQELADACEVIEWLADQPWCSGSVGMMGKSWGGFNALQTGFLQPPALKAVIAVCATTDRFAGDIHFKGGCLLGENFGWGSLMLSYSSRPADPELRADWRSDWIARLEVNPWLAPRWADLQERSDYWAHGSVCKDYARMVVPVLAIGGWADNYMNTVIELVENNAGCVKGIIGPWGHHYPNMASPGPQIGFLQTALRWWDRWLKGMENGVEDDPALRAYMLHSAPPDASAAWRAGDWVAVQDWPSTDVSRLYLPLSAGRLGGEGPFMAHVASPQHLGLSAGKFFPMSLNGELPGDQQSDDAMSLCFDGDVLAKPMALLGSAQLSLTLCSDHPLGFVVARLCDVAPDGSSVRIAHGMLNLCHRDGAETPVAMVPGLAVRVQFALDHMGYRVAEGHRLRLALSNSYWPFVWPSPVAGTLTLTAGSLDLPIYAGGAEWIPPMSEGAGPNPQQVLRPVRQSRHIVGDPESGLITLLIEDDQGDVLHLSHGLCSGETVSERWEIHPDDPLSARVVHHWAQRLSRGDWQVRIQSQSEMTCTATGLRMTARVTAYEGDALVFSRDYDETVARRFV